MNAQDFLLAHGEKIAVPLVGVVCAWLVYGVATSPDIRPKEELNIKKIEEEWGKVQQTFNAVEAPVLNPPPNLLEQMQKRLARRSEAAPALAWLTAHPDLGKTIDDHLFLYVYELPGVEVTAKDQIGTVAVSITLPKDVRQPDPLRRLRDGKSVTWERTLAEKIINRAGWVGVQLQVRVSGGEWTALPVASFADGIIPMAQFKNGTFTTPVQEPWAEHRYRARLIAKATGLPIPPSDADIAREKPSTASIVVVNGRYQAEDEPLLDGDALLANFRKDPAKFLARCNSGTSAAMKVAGDTLAANERYYLSEWSPASDENAVVPTDRIRFALQNVRVDPNANVQPGVAPDPQAPVAYLATFLVTRLVDDPKGGAPKWMTKPFQYKDLRVGDMIGKDDERVDNPHESGKNILQELATPFQIESIATDARVFYYQYYLDRRPGGKRDEKVVAFKPFTKAKNGEVVLVNTKTQKKIVVVQLSTIAAPPANLAGGQPVIAIFPKLFANGYDEIDAFTKNPATFQIFGKKPPLHKEHAPGTGPILDVQRQTANQKGHTDVPYVELPDDRLIWFDHINAGTAPVAQWPEVKAKTPAPPTTPQPGVKPPIR